MLEDFDTNVTKLATFLGLEVTSEKLEDIKIATSFDKMKQRLAIGTPGHLRHGKSKAYVEKLSPEVVHAFDAKSKEWFAESDYLDKFLF